MNTALRFPGNALSPMQSRRFWRDGYVRVESLLNKEELSELRSAHDRLRTEARASGDFGNFIDLDAAEEGDQVMNIPQVCQRDIAFQRLLYHPHLLDIVEDLIGCNIQLFHDHLLHKPPEYGGPVFWHQDNQAWQSMPASNKLLADLR
jgi:phytanoyl-CoA hydroxylase